MVSLRARLSFVFLLAAACAAHAAPTTKWTIEPLGSLGTRATYAYGMNNRGEIVGESYTTLPEVNYGNYFHSFVWDGAMRDVGTPAGVPNSFSYLMAINDRGTAVGSHNGGAYLYRDGVWTSLGLQGYYPADINRFDQVVGSVYNDVFPQGYHAFLYRNGTVLDLGGLGGFHTHATAINDRGAVVGQATLPNGTARAFLWEKGVMRDLGSLAGSWSFAEDINNHGVVVGRTMSATGETAFVYERGVMRAIVPDPAGSRAVAINDRGDVVGQVGISGAAFLYSDGAVTRLDKLPLVVAAGWTILIPQDINDRGWITGFGYRNGSDLQEAFVLKPR